MVRLLTVAFLLLGLTGFSAADDIVGPHRFSWGFEAGYVDASGLPSWTEGDVGKLRYQDDGLMISRAYLDYEGQLTDTLKANIVFESYDEDGIGLATDLTEAFLEWRPVPRSANRYRVKIGTFYPHLSLENVDAGWSSPYTLNSSAINTWIAEELRSTGLEVKVSRRPESLGGAHTFALSVAAFLGNDTAGTMLAWKGWSIHDRQTRFQDDLPLPPLPQIQPGALFQTQAPFSEPVREVDERVGYHISGEWRWGKKLLVQVMHYDNKADPIALEHGQYGWTTKFDHLGVQTTLPGDIGLIGQWMFGSTVMGPIVDNAYVVDVEYDSWFLLATRSFERHRLTARYDRFEAWENDNIPEDDNSENGYAWTLGYQYQYSDTVTIAAEWLRIRTERPAFEYFGYPRDVTERQTQLMLRLNF